MSHLEEVFEDVLSKLENVKRNGDSASTRCPAHDDQHNSLSIKLTSERILLMCHAVCEFDRIAQALGRPIGDFFADQCKKRESTETRKFVKEYIYRDTEGRILYKKKRFALCRDGKPCGKTFDFEHLEGNDWKPKLGEMKHVLFNLEDRKRLVHELGRPTVICEGEKAAIRLQKLLGDSGWVTAVGGAKYWLPEFAELLKEDPFVVFLPDNDGPGKSMVTKAAQDLAARGRVNPTKSLDLPSLGPGEDPFDWIERGGISEEFWRIANECPIWKPASEEKLAGPEGIETIQLSTVKPQPVKWLRPNCWPQGKLSLVVGDPGLGKTFVSMDAAARSVFAVVQDPDEEESNRRFFAPIKMNLAPHPPALAFSIDGAGAEAKIKWGEAVDSLSVEAAIRGPEYKNRSEKDARRWLKNILEESGGELESGQIFKIAEEESLSRSTLYRAKEKLGIKARKDGFGEAGQWFWYLPAATDSSKSSIIRDVRPFEERSIETPTSSKSLNETLREQDQAYKESQNAKESKGSHVGRLEWQCPTCHGAEFWNRDDGGKVCSVCHPDPRKKTPEPEFLPEDPSF